MLKVLENVCVFKCTVAIPFACVNFNGVVSVGLTEPALHGKRQGERGNHCWKIFHDQVSEKE